MFLHDPFLFSCDLFTDDWFMFHMTRSHLHTLRDLFTFVHLNFTHFISFHVWFTNWWLFYFLWFNSLHVWFIYTWFFKMIHIFLLDDLIPNDSFIFFFRFTHPHLIHYQLIHLISWKWGLLFVRVDRFCCVFPSVGWTFCKNTPFSWSVCCCRAEVHKYRNHH